MSEPRILTLQLDEAPEVTLGGDTYRFKRASARETLSWGPLSARCARYMAGAETLKWEHYETVVGVLVDYCTHLNGQEGKLNKDQWLDELPTIKAVGLFSLFCGKLELSAKKKPKPENGLETDLGKESDAQADIAHQMKNNAETAPPL